MEQIILRIHYHFEQKLKKGKIEGLKIYIEQIEKIFRKPNHKIYLLMILNGALKKFAPSLNPPKD